MKRISPYHRLRNSLVDCDNQYGLCRLHHPGWYHHLHLFRPRCEYRPYSPRGDQPGGHISPHFHSQQLPTACWHKHWSHNIEFGTLVCTTKGGSASIVNPFFAGSQVRINLSLTIPGENNPVNAMFVGRITNGPGGVRVVFDNPIFTYSKDGLVFSILFPNFLELPICAQGCPMQEVKLIGSINLGAAAPVPEPTTLLLLATGLGFLGRW